MSINTTTLSGNVGFAELQSTKSGLAILVFSLAVDEYRKDQDTYTNWITCKMFGTRAEKLEPYIKKGIKLAVKGRLHQERWEKDGKKFSAVSVTVDDVEFMSSREQTQSVAETVQNAIPGAVVEEVGAYQDEDIPF